MATLTPLWTLAPLTDHVEIKRFLAERGVAFETWAMPEEALALGRLAQLDDAGKARLLALFADKLADKATTEGYRSADVVAIRPHLAGIEEALAKFDKVHFHDDDEVRAIVGGQGVFGLIGADGRQLLLHMVPGEYVSLPKGSWHWFYCLPDRNVTAIRLFKDNPAWVAHYRENTHKDAG